MDASAFLHGADPEPVTPKLPAHRPSGYTDKIAEAICERIAAGETLRDICATDGYPSKSTIFRWTVKNPDFRALYTEAMRWRSQGRADEIIEIADDGSQDWETVLEAEGAAVQRLNKEAIARSKLRIQCRQWLLERELPKKYGANPEPETPLPPPDEPKLVNPTETPVLEHDPLAPSASAWDKAAVPQKS